MGDIIKNYIENIYKKIRILESNYNNLNKNEKKELKNLYKQLKIYINSCNKRGHNYGDWIDYSWVEDKQNIDNFGFYNGYIKIYHYLYKRQCIDCGQIEYRENKINENNKKRIL